MGAAEIPLKCDAPKPRPIGFRLEDVRLNGDSYKGPMSQGVHFYAVFLYPLR